MNKTEQRLLQLFDELKRNTIDLHAFFELVGGNTPDAQRTVLIAIESLLKQGLIEERGGDFYARTEAGRDELNKERTKA